MWEVAHSLFTVIGFIESLSSYYLAAILLVIGIWLRFRYYTAYRDRNLQRDAQVAKYGGYICMLLSMIVLAAHFIFI